MTEFDIILDEENTLSFGLEIQGASTKNMQTRLVIKTEDINLIFDGRKSSESDDWEVKLPILAQTIVPGTYDCDLEIILEGEKFFRPLTATANAFLPTKVKAGIKNAKKAPRPTKQHVSIATSEIVAQSKPVEEVKEEETFDKVEAKEALETMERSIEQFATEIKLREGREFEVKNMPVEIKEINAEGTFMGYGSVFGNIDSYKDVVEKGAFKKTLQNRKNVKLLWQHNQMEPIGVFDEMYEDDYGLVVKGRLAMDVQRAREAYSLMQMGAVDGLSIGYSTIKSDTDRKTGIRYLKELKLYEVSVVTMPANEAATVTSLKDVSKGEQETINKDISSLRDDSKPVEEHSDVEPGATHSKNEPSKDHLEIEADDDNGTEEIKTSLQQLLTTLGTSKNG